MVFYWCTHDTILDALLVPGGAADGAPAALGGDARPLGGRARPRPRRRQRARARARPRAREVRRLRVRHVHAWGHDQSHVLDITY